MHANIISDDNIANCLQSANQKWEISSPQTSNHLENFTNFLIISAVVFPQRAQARHRCGHSLAVTGRQCVLRVRVARVHRVMPTSKRLKHMRILCTQHVFNERLLCVQGDSEDLCQRSDHSAAVCPGWQWRSMPTFWPLSCCVSRVTVKIYANVLTTQLLCVQGDSEDLCQRSDHSGPNTQNLKRQNEPMSSFSQSTSEIKITHNDKNQLRLDFLCSSNRTIC